jgi:hypothetical protein
MYIHRDVTAMVARSPAAEMDGAPVTMKSSHLQKYMYISTSENMQKYPHQIIKHLPPFSHS